MGGRATTCRSFFIKLFLGVYLFKPLNQKKSIEYEGV